MSNYPEWLKTAVFYEIYPQSFMDTNGDGIGDLQGIIGKLDYIKELGCSALWLNPCFVSPFGDAGYDVEDYYRVAPRYGTNEDMRQLITACHERGMHLLLDLVPCHTAVTHPWFVASSKHERNQYSDRFIWTDCIWHDTDGLNALRGYSERDGSAIVSFFSHQPALNYGFYEVRRPWEQPTDAEGPRETVAELKKIMRFWLDMGIDGYRVDMAACPVKNDPDHKGTMALWTEIREMLDDEYPEAAMIAEWDQPEHSIAGGFHMDFTLNGGLSNYTDLFRAEHPYFSAEGKGSAAAFMKRYLEAAELSGNKGLICLISGNHDTDRLARRLNGDELKIAFAFLLSMPGAPFIYYGDEIGMRYIENIASVEGGYGRTGSRSPMQWDKSRNAGFSTADESKLYIRQDEPESRPDAASQMADPDSLWNEIRRLIALRMAHPALQADGLPEVINDGYPLVYVREKADERILVAINPSSRTCECDCAIIPDREIYSFGGRASCDGKKLVMPGQSVLMAAF
ncbi:MAG: alpha-amylase family glycosyl hydrolase [Clostridia bacterium]|nr:alpha-amylase family glycosyl hydrolase [Clostridia bacterium]